MRNKFLLSSCYKRLEKGLIDTKISCSVLSLTSSLSLKNPVANSFRIELGTVLIFVSIHFSFCGFFWRLTTNGYRFLLFSASPA